MAPPPNHSFLILLYFSSWRLSLPELLWVYLLSVCTLPPLECQLFKLRDLVCLSLSVSPLPRTGPSPYYLLRLTLDPFEDKQTETWRGKVVGLQSVSHVGCSIPGEPGLGWVQAFIALGYELTCHVSLNHISFAGKDQPHLSVGTLLRNGCIE